MDRIEARVDRVHGALAGVAVGDSMGMPSEMWPRRRIRERFGSIERFLPAPEENDITRGLAAYEVTDDTRVTLLVAEAVVAGLEPLQTRYTEITADPAYLKSVLRESADRVMPIADATVRLVKQRMGIYVG